MSTCYRYNGTVLPALPATDYPYRVIVHGQDTDGNTLYMLWLCDKPFTKESDTVFSYPVDAAVAGYGANMSAYKWYAGTIQKDEGDADYYVMNGTFAWCDHDIYSRANPTQKAHAATEPEAITVQAPASITVTGGGTYDQGAAAGALTCTATSPNGGTLSYKWYRDGAVCGYAAAYVPSTKTAGTFQYYCIVTNALYGDKVTAQSDTITVTVNAVETETVTVRKPKEVIGYALKVCGVPMAELIAEMLCKGAAATATQYLYATPSESGNIGLRSGDSVVYYDGAVLPNIDTVYTDELKQTHPYAVIYKSSNYYYLNISERAGEVYWAFTDRITLASASWDNHWFNWRITESDTNWTEGNLSYEGGQREMNCVASDLIWSNYDVRYKDDYRTDSELNGTVYHAKSDPIPVTGIVAYSYNGTVLPELPEWDTTAYPYAQITEKSGVYYFTAQASESHVNSDDHFTILGNNVRYRCNNGAWEANDLLIPTSTPVWANYDVDYNEDAGGSLFMTASDPIPVYE